MPAFAPSDSATLRELPPETLCGMLEAFARTFRDRLSADPEFITRCGLPWPAPHDRKAVLAAFRPFTLPAIRRLVRLGTGPGTPWLLAILAGSVPAVPVNVLFWSLAARVPVILRPSRAGLPFVSVLAESLARAAPALSPTAKVCRLTAGTPDLDALIREAPACLAYGDDASVASVASLRPGRTTYAGGHRESVVVVFREAVTDSRAARNLARAVARDVAIYDQSGCLSPQAVLYEDGAVPATEFAGRLSEALRDVAADLPAGRPDVESAAFLRAFADEARLEARIGRSSVFSPGLPAPLVVLRFPGIPYRPGPGHRVVQVLPFSGIPAFDRLLPGLEGRIQGLALAGPRDRLAAAIGGRSAWTPCRACSPGRLQQPPAIWKENGIVLTAELGKGCYIPTSGNPFEISSW